MKFDLFKYLTALGFLYVSGRLIFHYILFLIRYLLDEGKFWNPKIEKPRLLFHLIGLAFMCLIYHSHLNFSSDRLPLQIFNFLVFGLGFFFCYLSWLKRFEVSFIPSPDNRSNHLVENFGLKISENEMTQLYNEMLRFDLLNQDLTSLMDFKSVLTKNWKEHNSKIHLKMDGPSAREFLDIFMKTFPGNNLTIKNFFQTSNTVTRTDGNPYNYHTVKNAPTRSTYSKKHEELKKIFQKFA